MKMSTYRGYDIRKDGACRFWIDTGPEGFDYGYFNSELACEEQIDMLADQADEERELFQIRLERLQARCRAVFLPRRCL